MIKICGSYIICLVVCGSLFANYDSLTRLERIKVTKAFEQSKFYKYYQDLVDGKDKIKIIKVDEISSVFSDASLKITYQMTLDLVINDKLFRRTHQFTIDHEIIKVNNKSTWKSYTDTAWKVTVGFLIGFVVKSFIK